METETQATQVLLFILLSIIVPVYNIEEYLERCVDSIRQQTWKNLEIMYK